MEYEELTFELRRCCFEVQNEIGLGRSEAAYHAACMDWLTWRQIQFSSKLPHVVRLQREEVARLIPDFVIENSISVELKAIPRSCGPAELVQLFDYLKFRGDRLGLLVNMGLDRVAIERIVYEPIESTWTENWDSWTGRIDGVARVFGTAIRCALQSVFEEHGTGYGDDVTGKLVRRALEVQGLGLELNPQTTSVFRGRIVDESSIDAILINGCILIAVSSLFETNDFNVNRCRSYLRSLGLRWGVAVNFGKTTLELIGLRHEL